MLTNPVPPSVPTPQIAGGAASTEAASLLVAFVVIGLALMALGRAADILWALVMELLRPLWTLVRTMAYLGVGLLLLLIIGLNGGGRSTAAETVAPAPSRFSSSLCTGLEGPCRGRPDPGA